jgi:drug/metabolite transporter (DMT)-like permease
MSLAVPTPGLSDNLRGILAMLASMASLIVNDCFVKIAAAELPTGETIFLRGVFTTLLGIGVIAATVGPGALRLAAAPRMPLRAGAEVMATFLYLSALTRMPIADATAILQFTPLALTAAAAVFLGAPVGWRRWLATFAGLIGVLIIVRPGGAGFNPYSSLALAAIVFVVARDILTRRLGAEVPTMVIAAISAGAVTAASLVLALFETWVWPSWLALAMMFCAGLGLLGGNYWIVVAMRSGDIATVGPFRYSIIPMAVLAGFLVWREVPDLATWIGIAIVTAAGLYTLVREHRLARALRA